MGWHARMHLADWSDFAGDLDRIRDAIGQGAVPCTPFVALSSHDDPALQLKLARSWAASNCRPATAVLPPLQTLPRPADGRIHIGYFSADFHDHATMHLAIELLERHDRSRFHVTAFSWGPRTGDTMQARAIAACDTFHVVRSVSDAGVAALSRELKVDIAVDLTGYTRHARTAIFAHRAAPVQVNFLGYAGTLGATFMDYIIADHHVIPQLAEQFYTERVVRMPNSFQPNQAWSPPTRVPPRSECGLPDEGVVFGCFNNIYKITPDVFALWMHILQCVPGSVMWLRAPQAQAQSNLRACAARLGVQPQRLVFAPPLPRLAHLERQACMDLFLDTAPYNAHTTASDALRAGVPVLANSGETFAARVSGSLLHGVGLPEMIVPDAQAYLDLAARLGNDRGTLKAVRAKLLNKLPICQLFDSAAYVRDLELAYSRMVARAEAGLAPAALHAKV